MNNNSLMNDSLNISYMALLADYKYNDEFLKLYPEMANSIEHISNISKRSIDFANVTTVLNHLKSIIEVEVKK